MSKMVNISSEAWLNFFGTILGSGMTVYGAYLVTIKQIDENNKELLVEKNEKNKIVQQLIVLLIKDEVDKNKKIYNQILKAKKQANKDRYILTGDEVFFDDEWIAFKYEILKSINCESINMLILSLTKLYNTLKKINEEINKYKDDKFPPPKELCNMFDDLDNLFMDVYKEMNKITSNKEN